MHIKKLAVLFLVLALLSTILTSCGRVSSSSAKSNASNSASSSTTTVTGQAPTLPLASAGTTLTVACPDSWYAAASFAKNLPVYQELQNETGVTVKWKLWPADQYGAAISTILASGQDLPDLFCAPSGNLDKVGYDGIAIPLNSLIGKGDAYYLSMMMRMQPIVKSSITAGDGNIYWYPGFGEGYLTSYKVMETGTWEDPHANVNLAVPGIRKDWLDKLGLQVPKTIDNWHNVLTAFKGMGKGIIPITCNWNLHDILVFANAYGLPMDMNARGNEQSGGYAVDSSGKVNYIYTDNRLKQTLATLAQWYKEGLIDPEFLQNNYESTVEKINKDVVGACADDWMSNYPSYTNNLKSVDAKAQYIPVAPPVNPNGKAVVANRWSIWKNLAISKDCKNPDLALKWIDYHCLSPNGIKLQMWGIKGQSYTDDGSGNLKYTDFVLKNSKGLGPFDAIRSIGGWGQLPYIQTKDAYAGLFSSNPDILSFSAGFTSNEIITPFPDPSCLPLSEVDTNTFSQLSTAIATFRDESIINFITGQKPLSQWDSYVKQINSMGVKQTLQIMQTAYDKFKVEQK